ncbi:MAG TPA: MBL fold metallo-hydrolase [Thermoanaerobaculia bacterium]|nr:MBL fold metallo-hydrolase [Thermoanaerobaculia bacterium]
MMLAALLLAALPPWSEGMLDIHQISTGRGNAALCVFPDGTTMLVDAGAAADGQPMADTDPRPNASKRVGEWIADYIAKVGVEKLDYAVITHFHADHMGGIRDVAARVPIGTLIDRGYAYLKPEDAQFRNYEAFAKEHGSEALRVGRNDQIVLRRGGGKYPGFEVRNVAANGVVWTGTGDQTANIFPPLDKLAAEDKPSENMCSIGLRIRYGKFDWFTGGDMPGVPDAGAPEWQSVETAVAKAIGPTDVHVVNHHGSIDPESAFFLSTLRSTVMVLPSWSATHPSQDALKRMMTQRLYPGPHDVFATLVREPAKISIGSRAAQLKADHGHIVIRVAPGGESYQVFVLDDATPERAVLATHGPYVSR